MAAETSGSGRGGSADDTVTQAQLVEVLRVVPQGALLLCGLAVTSLLLAWVAVYVFLFLARGFVN